MLALDKASSVQKGGIGATSHAFEFLRFTVEKSCMIVRTACSWVSILHRYSHKENGCVEPTFGDLVVAQVIVLMVAISTLLLSMGALGADLNTQQVRF